MAAEAFWGDASASRDQQTRPLPAVMETSLYDHSQLDSASKTCTVYSHVTIGELIQQSLQLGEPPLHLLVVEIHLDCRCGLEEEGV